METYLNSAKKEFERYKTLGEKTFAQFSDDALFWQYNAESKHCHNCKACSGQYAIAVDGFFNQRW